MSLSGVFSEGFRRVLSLSGAFHRISIAIELDAQLTVTDALGLTDRGRGMDRVQAVLANRVALVRNVKDPVAPSDAVSFHAVTILNQISHN